MLWLTLSLLTALAVATHDAFIKKAFSGLPGLDMAAYPMMYSLPMFLITLAVLPVPEIGEDFTWCLLVSLPINGVSFLLYVKAIRISPLSLTIPYLAFTPVFMILTGYLFLDEIPGPWGIAGILTICIGGYILNIEPGSRRLLSPLRAFFRETGSWIMLIVAFIYSFGAVIGKRGILAASPLFFNMAFFAVFNFMMVLLLMMIGKIRLKTFMRHPRKGFIAGGLYFLHAVFHPIAISMTQASYMISIKRLSVVFSILYGKYIFREANIAFRMSGAVLMLAGTLMIAFQGMQ